MRSESQNPKATGFPIERSKPKIVTKDIIPFAVIDIDFFRSPDRTEDRAMTEAEIEA